MRHPAQPHSSIPETRGVRSIPSWSPIVPAGSRCRAATTSTTRNAARPRASPWRLCMADRAEAATPRCAASTIPRATASCCSTSADAGAQRRTRRSTGTRPGTSWPTWSVCATHLGIEPGSFAAAPGDRRCPWPTPKRTRSASPSSFCAGIFLLRKAELDWFYQEGCSWIFPDAFESYLAPIPAAERGDMIEAYYRRLTCGDSANATCRRACLERLGGHHPFALPRPRAGARGSRNESYALAFARIECHYFINKGFFRCDNQLIEDAHRIAHIPGTIIHGRYDVVTPFKNAWDLAKAWPKAELRIVPDAGHAMTEPGIAHEIVTATDKYASAHQG